ncbi:arsenite efflux MFS transporter ArsK [Agrobacterium pusense]|uniref:arsenite efflux MFS transporter ArsK n=1 Tax=Agrobacterium pusense TaxID=648995 RepID=UPI000887203C|nr:arsenite efflux MFS transporter ArsK [Agrobacterium pusense]OOO15770.1 MFS transporter [Agrobacterium pusense]WKD48019.1 arsenite efflux MFS transporter ArsK [Agrobacterium pusense]SDF46439.1 Predicted arabinose efflux permease, MFS family [Agrobacterium pusense]
MTTRTPIAAVLILGLTQIIGYGTLYYSFSILAPDMAKDLAWSTEWVFGALSAALLIGGITAPWLGSLIDRIGAGRVMTVGSAVAALALIACAFAPGKVSYVLALIAIETAANLVQYGAAFALLVQLQPAAASRSITYLTLIAGFASTIFWPITTALHAQFSWQTVYLIFAGLNLAICLPLHGWLSHDATARRSATKLVPQRVEGILPPEQRSLGFALMVTAFSLLSLSSSAVLVHMVPLLSGLGLGTSAALIGTLFGPSQVASRLINMVFGKNLPALQLAIVAAVLIPGGVLILQFTAPSISGSMVFAVVFGMGNGLLSIVAGTLPLYLFGSDGYGKLQGKTMASKLVLSALAPFVMAFAMANIGIFLSLTVAAMLGALAIVTFGVIVTMQRAYRPSPISG